MHRLGARADDGPIITLEIGGFRRSRDGSLRAYRTDSERARLAEKLLSSLERDPDVEEAWAREIQRRVEQYRSGNLATVPAEDVMKEARGRIQS